MYRVFSNVTPSTQVMRYNTLIHDMTSDADAIYVLYYSDNSKITCVSDYDVFYFIYT